MAGIADTRLVLGLTRTRAWIGVLGSLLVGIVALNVMALSFNASSSKTASASDELLRDNSALRAGIADRLSNERLQSVAEKIGLVMPEAAGTLMLTPEANDAAEAAKRLAKGEITVGSVHNEPVAEPVVSVVPEVIVDPAVVIDPAVADPASTTEYVDPSGIVP